MLVVVATIAAVLVPAWAWPARTIARPATLARTIKGRSHGRARLAFNPTHVAFSWRGDEAGGVAFRSVGGTGSTTGWQRAPEAHDLEQEDRHFSAVISVDRPRVIVWRPVRARGSHVGDVTVDYLNTVDGPQRLIEVPATADAAARTPGIVTRAEWGADESLKRTGGNCKRSFWPVQQLFVHHTAGSNYDSNPAATMRAIYWFHVVRRGWCDIGYNFVISWGGRLFEGRWARHYDPWEVHDSETRTGLAASGAHVANFNYGSVGVSMMGNFSRAPVPTRARRTLTQFLSWETDRHNLAPRGWHIYKNPDTGATRRLPVIAGHRDAGYTDCPGGSLYRALPRIRRSVAAIVGEGKRNSMLSLTTATSRVTFGDGATVSGRLVDGLGEALGGRTVTLYRKPAGRNWKVAARVETNRDGIYDFSFVPVRNVKLAAVFKGGTRVWDSQSRDVAIVVAPLVGLSVAGGRQERDGVYHLDPGSEVMLHGDVRPSHPGARVTVRIYAVQPDGSELLVATPDRSLAADSTYEAAFGGAVPDTTYRAVTWFHADRDHVASPSSPVYFVVDA